MITGGKKGCLLHKEIVGGGEPRLLGLALMSASLGWSCTTLSSAPGLRRLSRLQKPRFKIMWARGDGRGRGEEWLGVSG